VPENDRFLVCSFFCDNKDNTRNHAVAIFQGLLYEIIRKCSVAAKHVTTWYRGRDERDLQNYSELENLTLVYLNGSRIRSGSSFSWTQWTNVTKESPRFCQDSRSSPTDEIHRSPKSCQVIDRRKPSIDKLSKKNISNAPRSPYKQ
jgi:hypothetical protein